MLDQPKIPNLAQFIFDGQSTEAEAEILIQNNEIGYLQGTAKAIDTKNQPEFDVVVTDPVGNEQKRVHFKLGESERFGQRVDLQLPHDRYKIRVENVKGAKSIDIFAE